MHVRDLVHLQVVVVLDLALVLEFESDDLVDFLLVAFILVRSV